MLSCHDVIPRNFNARINWRTFKYAYHVYTGVAGALDDQKKRQVRCLDEQVKMTSEKASRDSVRTRGTHSLPRHVSRPLYHFEHIDNLSTVIIPPFHFPQKRNATENPLHLKRYPVSFESTGEPAEVSFPLAGFPVSKEITRSEAAEGTPVRKEGKHRAAGARAMNTPLAGIRPRITYVHRGGDRGETSLHGYK